MWLVLSALAADCQTRLDTWVEFRPEASDTTWDYPGGWDKKRLAGFPDHRVAQAELEKAAFKRFPEGIQDALLNGELPAATGLDEVALKLAWGEPDYFWDTEDPGCRALLYGERSPPEVVDTCQGEIVTRHLLSAPIACSRLDAVAPRLKKRTLQDLDRGQAVQLLAGVPAVWMDEAALAIAYGDPRERKRGRNVYLDDRGYQPWATVELDEAGYAVRWTFEGVAPVGGIAVSSTPDRVPTAAPVPQPAVAPQGGETPAPQPAQPAPSPQPVTPVEPASGGTSAPGVTDGSAAGGTAPADVEGGSPRPPAANLPAGRHQVEGRCGIDAIRAKVEIAADGHFKMSARLDQGERTSIAVYRTEGFVRGSAERLSFEGVGSGVLSDAGLSVTLGPWPVPACTGVALTPAPEP